MVLGVLTGVACHSLCSGLYWACALLVGLPSTIVSFGLGGPAALGTCSTVHKVCETGCAATTGIAGLTAALQGQHPYLAVAALSSTCGVGCTALALPILYAFRRWRAGGGRLPWAPGKSPGAAAGGGGSPVKKDL